MATEIHRYWRLSFTTNGPLYPMCVAEFEMRGWAGGADMTYPSTAILASSQQVVNPASYAIDNNGATQWQAGNGSVPQWLRVDFGAPVAVRQLAITAPSVWEYTPPSFDLQYSDDGNSFTTIASYTTTLPWSPTTKIFDVPNGSVNVVNVIGGATAVEVDIDTPLAYGGAYSQTPPGSSYTIGQPTLDGTTQKLTVPINVSAPTAPAVVSVIPAAGQLQVLFDRDVDLLATSPSLWTVTETTGVHVTVTAVSIVARTVTLSTSAQTLGASYSLNVPKGAVSVAGTGSVNVASAQVFTGANVALTIVGSRYVDASDVVVAFSRAVDPVSAATPGNYVFTPLVTVLRVDRISDTEYIVRTSTMQSNTPYSVTVSGVHAADGTLI